MPFTIVRQDITKIKTDAIVNTTNTKLLMSEGVCGAIFTAAGAPALQNACNKLAPIQVGDAVITPGFMLPAKYIIHTAGPVYRDGRSGEEDQLRSCYLNSLKRAVENNCISVAFPLISSGIYAYPKGKALLVATSIIKDFLAEHDIDVYLVVFDKEAFTISAQLYGEVTSYIDEYYVEKYKAARFNRLSRPDYHAVEADLVSYNFVTPIRDKSVEKGIDALVGNLDEPFSATLLRLIDAKGKTDVEIYKRANLDRKLFSKIRKGRGYMPSKRTAVALAVALELSVGETNDLLKRAGYILSHSHKFDVIVEYFIVNGKYDIFEINSVLFNFDQPLLGG